MATIIDWIKKNPAEFWILLAILVLGTFFRLYKINEYMTFLGDEGRDVIIVRRFLTEFHPPLIGPGTSVGNMYLGPLYYYMMAPALLIANFSPVGPAIQIAILGVITVWLIWYVVREWFPNKTIGNVQGTTLHISALIAAFLYAISPTVIIFSRSSWNPNIMPFFALLSVWSIWKVWQEHQPKWLIVLGVSFAFVLQSHYLGLLLAPILFLFWFLSLRNVWKDKVSKTFFVRYSLLAILLFAVLMSPLLFFDLRHNWQNSLAIKAFFTSDRDIGFSVSTYVTKLVSVFSMLFTNLVAGKNIYLGVLVILISLLFLVFLYRNKILSHPYVLLLTWLVIGVLGASYYKGPVYDHYLGFLFPVPFLLMGAISQFVFKSKNMFFKIVLSLVLILITIISFKNNPPIVDPTMQLPRSIAVAKIIQEKANGQPFNLATISDLNNRDVYEYFLLIWGAKVVDADPSSTQFTITDQLFVVCEFPREKCDPIHDPSAWITNFGWTKITDEWEVWGGTLFKLGHTK